MKSISLRRTASGLAPWLVALAAAFAITAQAQPETDANNEQPTTNNVVSFDIPAQELSSALIQFSDQAGIQVVTSGYDVIDHTTNGVSGSYSANEALDILLEGTGLTFQRVGDGTISLALPQSGAVAGQNTIGQRRPGIEEIIVTGQKREERIQDVPIAISAFTMEDLKTSQIAGGPDLHLQVPNMTFTKTNFTGYSIQIRGIGTQAISATTDPAVAVALNNTPFIRNAFFEQEFYDLERVEVLRGPQGTLYGRNATAGVVNLITAKPKFQEESMFSLDMGNYNSRRWEFMVNKPLVDDQVALRVAAAGTKRDGYATNELTNNSIDGRDLWSGRVSLRFAPTNGNFDLNLIYEHFEEDDARLRSGKQLCHKDVVNEVAGFPTGFFKTLPETGREALFVGAQASFSQGCKRGSLYSDNAFQTPNGLMLPYYLPVRAIGLKTAIEGSPYVDADQSRDLRVIESRIDPEYRAQSDIAELQIKYELTDTLTLDSETAYGKHSIFSLQDFNRFNTAPGVWVQPVTSGSFADREGVIQEGPDGGIFCDPQLGCSDRLVVVDVSSAESTQFSQEFRLSSQFAGPFDFSLGANYLRYDTVDKFYVFANSFTQAMANNLLASRELPPWVVGESDNSECLSNGFASHDPNTVASLSETDCFYIDPNPIGSLNDLGHNYFLSKNPYELNSYAVFGETYYRITDNLKLTAGLRWSVDKKEAPRIPSQLFTGDSVGHPVAEVIKQTWREPTGRLVLDWKPNLGFTDETLLYGSYSHGYKAGGANPPILRFATRGQIDVADALQQKSVTKPKTFDAEFVDAFEIGTKNTLLDGALTFNLTGFYYDYEDYQISEIVDRSAFNRNFDAEIWGMELETDWWARENLRLGLKLGYEKTRIKDGEQAIDLMDRTAGGKHFFITDAQNPNFDPNTPESELLPSSEYVAGYDAPSNQQFFAFENWVIHRPFPTYPSSCVLPEYLFIGQRTGAEEPILVNVGSAGGGGLSGCELAYQLNADPVRDGPITDPGLPYVPNPPNNTLAFTHRGLPFTNANIDSGYPGFNPEWAPNNGEGFFKDLGGNEFPNAPNWTATVTADYIVPLKGDWLATLHTDIYWQSESWWRIFNDHEFNRIDDYFTMNLAAIFANERTGWDIMAYVKNVTDEDALTGAFLYSDDTGLTTNTFLVEPRLYGVRVTKHWDGGGPASWLGGAGAALMGREPGQPNPWELTVVGQMLRPKESAVETFSPAFISSFDPNIDPTGEQEKDLDWGDGREIVLAYAPENGWRFSLGARWGQANEDLRKTLMGETVQGCAGKYEDCLSGYNEFTERTNYGVTELSEVEEHLLIDFMIGRDVGLGRLLEGTFSAGLRFADFQSRTDVMLRGTPDFDPPAECWFFCGPVTNTATHNEYLATMETEREFQGIGPVIAWEASNRLWGEENAGHVDLDWSVSGGVLFGKQETTAEGVVEQAYFQESLKYTSTRVTPVSTESASFNHERDDDSIATVPTLGASLGLTYRLGGASIGAGYGWERYYSVIDGGIEERRSYDRTIDGPYLKVTFGGGS